MVLSREFQTLHWLQFQGIHHAMTIQQGSLEKYGFFHKTQTV
jgi:hypothetical protein